MVIVTLEDGTRYCIDSDNSGTAKRVVDYKLRDRMDYRHIKDTELFEGIKLDKNMKYYNSDNPYDGVPLQSKTGWSYKWPDGSSAEFSRNL